MRGQKTAGQLYLAEFATSQQPGLLISRPDELSAAAFAEKINCLATAGLYAVAEIDGHPVGHALVEPLHPQAISHVFSSTIVVHPGNTQQGLGTALMKYLMDWATGNQAVEKSGVSTSYNNIDLPAQSAF